MGLIIALADAVVTALNGAVDGTFNAEFTAVRAYRPQFNLEGLETLRVSVVPRSLAMEAATRTSLQRDVQIDVAVQKKVNVDDAAVIDAQMALVEQIAEFFKFKRLPSVGAIWLVTQNAPIYSAEHLEQHRVFTSMLTLTFRIVTKW